MAYPIEQYKLVGQRVRVVDKPHDMASKKYVGMMGVVTSDDSALYNENAIDQREGRWWVHVRLDDNDRIVQITMRDLEHVEMGDHIKVKYVLSNGSERTSFIKADSEDEAMRLAETNVLSGEIDAVSIAIMPKEVTT